MSVNFGPKDINWVTEFVALCKLITIAADTGAPVTNEFTDETFGNGGANALTDAAVQVVLPSQTAASVWAAEGAVVNILAAITTNRGYLDNMKP